MNDIRVAIIDYQMSNLYSVKNACDHNEIISFITSDRKEIMDADAVILPGVGAFAEAMNNLKKLDLISPIRDFITTGRPFMGTCLGMQLLLSESEEFQYARGLGLIKGKVTRFPKISSRGERIKVPHIGWNSIHGVMRRRGWDKSALRSVRESEYMYFVHSYYVVPENESDILTTTTYSGIEFCSSIARENIFATQFHPEKSSREGMKIYREWLSDIRDKKRRT
ncbi:MAG: imidazole glycerol phosphate synthase subunit HisH [Candidatus Omnitrophica bacterium]|nr:imidazole glycerol phosphate synthase subunit HisH [Candidatus Omnitrophota bacterium]MDD4012800.1 imidazole glycerol phosphate synthase subunit HisH [Candidatus Omnitrophota bacterium]